MKRPNMDDIENNFIIFERPSADQSREMLDYIYELEKHLSTIVQHSLSGSDDKSSSPKSAEPTSDKLKRCAKL